MDILTHPAFIPTAILTIIWVLVILMWRTKKFTIMPRLGITAIGTIAVLFGIDTYWEQTALSPYPKWWGILAFLLTGFLFIMGSLEKSRTGNNRPDLGHIGGYVYIISNKAHKDGIIKIGMTEQSDYMVRIDQLYDTSAPYPFDIHLIIKTDNPRGLEGELHRIFAKKRLNKRREFFEANPKEVLRKMPQIGNPEVIVNNL